MITKRVNASIESGDDPGSFEAVISTEAVDRDGDILPLDKWVLPDHIPVNRDHSTSVSAIIGSGEPFIEDGLLKMRATFANTDEAQHIRGLVVDGHLTGCSVEFLKHPDGRNELVGVAMVSVPSNPNARVVTAKSATSPPQWFLDRLDGILSGVHTKASDTDEAGAATALRVRIKALA